MKKLLLATVKEDRKELLLQLGTEKQSAFLFLAAITSSLISKRISKTNDTSLIDSF